MREFDSEVMMHIQILRKNLVKIIEQYCEYMRKKQKWQFDEINLLMLIVSEATHLNIVSHTVAQEALDAYIEHYSSQLRNIDQTI